MIDEHGYRPNVGIVLCNRHNEVFWARRCGQDGWQFPQGGIRAQEAVEDAMYRELREEVGLLPSHIEILGRTRDWLHYELPDNLRRHPHSTFRGQKQIWYLLRLIGKDQDVRLDVCAKPEFDEWRWIAYWSALDHIITFKRQVYQQALAELEPYLTSVSLHD